MPLLVLGGAALNEWVLSEARRSRSSQATRDVVTRVRISSKPHACTHAERAGRAERVRRQGAMQATEGRQHQGTRDATPFRRCGRVWPRARRDRSFYRRSIVGGVAVRRMLPGAARAAAAAARSGLVLEVKRTPDSGGRPQRRGGRRLCGSVSPVFCSSSAQVADRHDRRARGGDAAPQRGGHRHHLFNNEQRRRTL